MRFNFKIQQYQTEAVDSVVSVFRGQPCSVPGSYHRDTGRGRAAICSQLTFEASLSGRQELTVPEDYGEAGFRNEEVALSDEVLLANIREIQQNNHVRLSDRVINQLGRCSLDVEMETGTGKTYVYIKTMYELNRRYGWSKFIVVVPSIAVREGVKKSFEITREHFMEQYGRKLRFFVYSSGSLNQLDAFAGDSGISVMIINMQAFNTSMKEGGRSREARIIYDERDEFGSRRPIDVIKATRPIIILDEPQKMGGDATQKALRNFNPLFCLNYSATHKEHHNLVYVLDAVDAYNQKLVKKIEVKGFHVKNFRGTDRYLYLESIIVSPKHPPRARIELEIKYDKSINRETRILEVGDSLYELSKHMEQYRGCRIAEIDPAAGSVAFTDGEVLYRGEVTGDISEKDMRRIQIRETILSHMEKEEELFNRGIKTLSLFFIDEVSKYRLYGEDGEELPGEYGRMFEEEYRNVVNDYITVFDTPYQRYLKSIDAEATHKGYFSIDKKGRAVNSDIKRGADFSDDITAYDLILKNKERLLSFDEPVRFIFSHSALREGWDNPNVFQICTLKHGDSATMKRQEVGRGLRLCVNQEGLRMDEQCLGRDMVHKVNKLTVIASESYREFVLDLQRQIKEVLYDRTDGAPVDDKVLREMIGNGRIAVCCNELNENFAKKEFQALWNKINHKYAYTVDFDSDELIRKAIEKIDSELFVTQLQYTVSKSEQRDAMSAEMVKEGASFYAAKSRTVTLTSDQTGRIRYDLIGKVAEGAGLTRRTAAAVLQGISPVKFAMFRDNPEEFITKVVRLIREQKAAVIVEHISYDRTEGRYDSTIFTAEKRADLDRAYRAKKHIQDYVFTDSAVERSFAEELDGAEEVCVYAKLPRGFAIPTPVGNYTPDWAIAFYEGAVRHIYFIAETKGTLESMELRPIEKAKISCAKKLFNEISTENVVYHEVDSYQNLLNIMVSVQPCRNDCAK